MPVSLKNPENRSCISAPVAKARANSSPGRTARPASMLAIGLLNNMSDGALEATEWQFRSLLESAAEDRLDIQLSLYHFPEVPRGTAARRHMNYRYQTVESLWDNKLDGLIVTGREPLFPNLRDEPYWNSFVQVHEWARENTSSTIWSCLAAHAAALHRDGIERQKNHIKHYGVFECARVATHSMMADVPSRFRLPHSRWNGLPQDRLADCGYQVLTQAEDAGVDCFVKDQSSLFVYFQGHPEYESETLLLEYRRDVGRYLSGEASAYPSIPRGYFDPTTEQNLIRAQKEADARPHRETLGVVASAASSVVKKNGWSATATTLYRNWLSEIRMRKNASEQSADVVLPENLSSPGASMEAIEDAVA